jgi:signal transduction histidine kinase
MFAAARAEHGPEDAIALVQRAAEFLRTHDRETALAAFSDPKGGFRDGDLYLFVIDDATPDLTMLAHGSNPGLIGMKSKAFVDADGFTVDDHIAALADANGEGWVDYKWPDPVTKKIRAKSSYVLKVGTLILAAGIYK